MLGKGNGTFQNAAVTAFSALSGNLLAGDLNGDAKIDLLIGSTAFLGNGDGTFNQLPPLFNGLGAVTATALADFNGDGKLDVLGSYSVGSVLNDVIFLGNGDGTFGNAISIPYVNNPPHDNLPPIIQVADMNGDGRNDLIVENSQSVLFVLLNTTAPVPGANFSPASVIFSSQTVGSSISTPVIVTNTGTAALTVTGITLAGANAGEFTQTNSCATIQPSTNCTINVKFAPTAAGSATANLIVADNAGAGSQVIVLSGIGMAASDFTFAAGSGGSSQTISAGQTATFNVNLTPAGSFTGTVNLTCAITPAATPAPVCSVPSSVSVTGSSATAVTVTVATAASGTAAGISSAKFPSGPRFMEWSLLIVASGLLFVGGRRRLPALALPMILFAFVAMAGCGNGSPSRTGGTSTAAGTYTATITGISGSVSHQTTLTVTVQ